MKTSTLATWFCASLIANTAVIESAAPYHRPPPSPLVRHAKLEAGEIASLRACSTASLESLRAGQTQEISRLGDDDRAALARAEQQSPGLDLLRAGEITNEDLGTILIIAAVIIVVAILL